jgi:hypothetical protein
VNLDKVVFERPVEGLDATEQLSNPGTTDVLVERGRYLRRKFPGDPPNLIRLVVSFTLARLGLASSVVRSR